MFTTPWMNKVPPTRWVLWIWAPPRESFENHKNSSLLPIPSKIRKSFSKAQKSYQNDVQKSFRRHPNSQITEKVKMHENHYICNEFTHPSTGFRWNFHSQITTKPTQEPMLWFSSPKPAAASLQQPRGPAAGAKPSNNHSGRVISQTLGLSASLQTEAC